jgi:SAM-dependent methyltransferase
MGQSISRRDGQAGGLLNPVTNDKPWHENDDFWRTMAPVFFCRERWEKTPEQVDQVLALLEPAPGSAILDLCCGPGRHSLELARRGFLLTGIDRTKIYLEEAKIRAASENLSVEFLLADMREFRRPQAFDAVINLFTSFGYFADPADDLKVLENVFHSLKPGGRLLMELMGKEVLARIFTERTWSEADGIIVVEEHKVADDWNTMTNRWIVFDRTERTEFNFSHRLFSAAELGNLLQRVGFAQVEFFGSLAGIPYDTKATRLVARATK